MNKLGDECKYAFFYNLVFGWSFFFFSHPKTSNCTFPLSLLAHFALYSTHTCLLKIILFCSDLISFIYQLTGIFRLLFHFLSFFFKLFSFCLYFHLQLSIILLAYIPLLHIDITSHYIAVAILDHKNHFQNISHIFAQNFPLFNSPLLPF